MVSKAEATGYGQQALYASQLAPLSYFNSYQFHPLPCSTTLVHFQAFISIFLATQINLCPTPSCGSSIIIVLLK